MNQKNYQPRLLLIISMILAGAFMRLIPHWPNFTPIAALALFGGTYIRRKELAFIIPLTALLLSDLILGFHKYMIAVYLSFAVIVTFGFMLRKSIRIIPVLAASFSGSVLFFLVTNFAVWVGSPFYPQTFAGLLESYTAGLPFLNNGILGDLFFNTVFFGGFYILERRFSVFGESRS
jgi:hypothetical protein